MKKVTGKGFMLGALGIYFLASAASQVVTTIRKKDNDIFYREAKRAEIATLKAKTEYFNKCTETEIRLRKASND